MAWEPIKKLEDHPEVDFGAGVKGVARSVREIDDADNLMEILRLFVIQDGDNPNLGRAEIAWNPQVFAIYKEIGQLKMVAEGLRAHADDLDKIHAEWEKKQKK
jgi:hypothetical protein